jgi:hypothetical protein
VKLKLWITMAQAAFSSKKTFRRQQTGLKSKDETGVVLHLEHSIV